jgi:hypothetical protein
VLENKQYRFVRPSAILSARELSAKEASRVFELLTRAEQQLGATVLGLSPELFEQLARDASSELRAAVASNERIPSALLSGLVRDENEDVRERAARNANLLPEDALFVAQEGAPSLRIQLISSSARLDSDVLAILARRGPQYAADVARKLLAERGHGPSAWEKGLPLSRLLKRAKVELSAKKANALLAEAGILEERTRPSSKDPSRTRAFKALTRVGQEFGYNKESGHAEQTAPVYFPSRFDELVARYLSES